jgi:2-amino-4-hydroxy-6-hydroxymethyldihydropteridine diphosphokinase
MNSEFRIQNSEFQKLAFVALGSNLGDARQNILNALASLQALSRRPLLQSSLWRTSPVGCPPGSPPFVNAVAALAPLAGETPESLLKKLQELEKKSGRAPKQIPNAPRPLDLDLLAFGPETRRTEALTLPHPRAHQRRFVLQPLSEIAPDLILPGQTLTVAGLLAALPDMEMVARLA